jgi:hypothetical protein
MTVEELQQELDCLEPDMEIIIPAGPAGEYEIAHGLHTTRVGEVYGGRRLMMRHDGPKMVAYLQ